MKDTLNKLKEAVERAMREGGPDYGDDRKWVQRTPRGGSGTGGIGTIIFGLIFAAVGTLICLRAANVITAGKVHVPMPILFVVGGIFGLPGVAIIGYGFVSMWRSARGKRRLASNPREPWLADHPWDTRYARDDGVRKIVKTFAGVVFVGAFLVPFHWIGLTKSGAWPMLLFVALFDLVIVGMTVHGIRQIVQRFKYGRSKVRYAAFPFFLGDMFEVEFLVDKGIVAAESIEFTLRCIEERREVRKSKSENSTTHTTVCYELWSDTYRFDEAIDQQAGDALSVSFLLPDRDIGTQLMVKEPRYWELEIKAVTPGVDFEATYLVPVYARGG